MLSSLLHSLPATLADSPQDSTDEQVMELILSRDQDALALLHKRYARFLKTIALKVVNNDADAEDLVQEVFSQIWDRIGNYDPSKGRALGWITTLTRRRAIDRLRKREVYSRVEERFTEELKSHPDGWTHVHEDVAHTEMSYYLEHAIAALPALQQTAIRLAYHGEMSQREVAAHTGLPLGTIKTRLELGLQKMRRLLSKLDDLIWVRQGAVSA
jgi:RNA polymerase sigma-70 factor (ECF subfamily)